MSSELRYDLAGALGRIYRTRTEILGIAEAAASDAGDETNQLVFDPADIPEGTPRAIWLTTLVKLASAGRRRAIEKLIADARQRSVEEDWDRFRPLTQVPSSKSGSSANESSFVRAELDVRWSGEKADDWRQTMVSSVRTWLEVTVTLTWDGNPPHVDLAKHLVCDTRPIRLWRVSVATSDETNVATYRGIFSISPVSWKTRVVEIRWTGPGEGVETLRRRRLVHRSTARVANLVWFGAVVVLPVIWLRPFGFLPTMIVSLASTSLAALATFGARFLDTKWLRARIKESLANLKRAVSAFALSALLLVTLTPLVFHQVINATDQPVDLGDRTVVPPHGTVSRFFWESDTTRPPFELCTCGATNCKCRGRASAPRFVSRSRIDCPEDDCVRVHDQILGAEGVVLYPHGLHTRPVNVQLGAATSSMRARAGDPTATDVPTVTVENVSAARDITLPVPIGDKFVIELSNAGTLACDKSAQQIRAVVVDGGAAELSTLHGQAGTAFSWTWKPSSTEHARICSAQSSSPASFTDLGILTCTGPFVRLGAFSVDIEHKSEIRFSSGGVDTLWKPVSTKPRSLRGRGWTCLSPSTQLEIKTALSTRFHMDLPQRIQTVRFVDTNNANAITEVNCSGRVWIVSLPHEAFLKIKHVSLTRIANSATGVACNNQEEPEAVESVTIGERTCTVDAARVTCTSTGVRYRGDCVLNGGNQIVRREHRCRPDQQLADNSELATTVVADARAMGFVCKRVFRCD